MGRHKTWRNIAKRERRRKIRTRMAKERDFVEADESEHILLFEMEQIKKANMEANEKWLQAEMLNIENWNKLQEKKEQLQLKQIERETKLKLEFEAEQKRKMEEEERLRQIEEENKRNQEIFMKKLEQFVSGDSADPPNELLISKETRPNTELCPFFSKTACCRFGDQCSRNHQYPGISKVLLAAGFFVHFGLNNSNSNEYDTDLMLEYEDSDTYKEFNDFFFDILPEFEKFGTIVQLKVCNNYEKHLRGNTYIEFAELRCAVAAYRSLHSRWYGGRQISLQFCLINSWKNAICGLQSRKRCPKGRACNFLHVFRNPNNYFASYDYSKKSQEEEDLSRSMRTNSRSWRWSESPERDAPRRRHRRSSSSPDIETQRRTQSKSNGTRKRLPKNRCNSITTPKERSQSPYTDKERTKECRRRSSKRHCSPSRNSYRSRKEKHHRRSRS